MFGAYKSAAQANGLGAPMIADGCWGAAHHNLHTLHTADERTMVAKQQVRPFVRTLARPLVTIMSFRRSVRLLTFRNTHKSKLFQV